MIQKQAQIPLLEMNGILGYDLMKIDIENIQKVASLIQTIYESDNFLPSLYGSDKYPTKNKTKIIVQDEDTASLVVARLKSVGLSDAMMPKIEVSGIYILDINTVKKEI